MLFSLAALTAGCIFTSPLAPGFNTLTPGTYYVEQRDDKLFALGLARSDAPTPDQTATEDWLQLSDPTEWYQGPGVYVLSDDMQWTPTQQTSTATLDEVIQLNDAPPPP